MAHNILLHRRANAIWHLKAETDLTDKVLTCGEDILRNLTMQSEQHYMQHGVTDCFTHSICVAYMALRVARFFSARIDVRSLVRGCLLHDYFLYDWHEKEDAPKFHTFRHPIIALQNAERDFELNPIERDIIRKHMFPLCFPFPKYKESFIITIADKCCAASEIWHLYSLSNIIQSLQDGMNARGFFG